MKNLLKLKEEAALNEIIFSGKNKAYGAYALRTEADYFLQKALISGMFLFGSVLMGSIIWSQMNTSTEVEKTPTIPQWIDVEPIDNETKDPVKPTPTYTQPARAAISVKTEKYVVVTPVVNPTQETIVPTTSEIKGSAIGFEKKDGEAPTNTVVPTQNTSTHTTGNGTGTATNTTIQPQIITKTNEPATVVDEEATFQGGLQAFRSAVSENFDVSSMEGEEGMIQATVSFVVEIDGTLSNVNARGNNPQFNAEAEKTIKKIRGKWQAAKINGEKVRSYYKIPISMKFE